MVTKKLLAIIAGVFLVASPIITLLVMVIRCGLCMLIVMVYALLTLGIIAGGAALIEWGTR